jgi:hypothetical protein
MDVACFDERADYTTYWIGKSEVGLSNDMVQEASKRLALNRAVADQIVASAIDGTCTHFLDATCDADERSMTNLCPSCREPLDYPSGDGCAAMTMHQPVKGMVMSAAIRERMKESR